MLMWADMGGSHTILSHMVMSRGVAGYCHGELQKCHFAVNFFAPLIFALPSLERDPERT